MNTGVARRRYRRTKVSTRRAVSSHGLTVLARAGLTTRGVMYAIIGWIALEVAFGHSGRRADSSGALRLVGSTAVGRLTLWLLFIGFLGLALWRLSQAAYGAPGPNGHQASQRALALLKVIIYGFIAYGTVKYALGLAAPASTNKQSRDLTSALMRQPAGQILVILAGLALIGAGVYVARGAWQKRFLREIPLSGIRPRTLRVVERLGQIGGMARGVVFSAAGLFLVIAAARANPHQAKGIDSTLRALASTPLGPLLLVIIAAGLITFGVFSCCQARWLRSA